jgi:hypothetical protein
MTKYSVSATAQKHIESLLGAYSELSVQLAFHVQLVHCFVDYLSRRGLVAPLHTSSQGPLPASTLTISSSRVVHCDEHRLESLVGVAICCGLAIGNACCTCLQPISFTVRVKGQGVDEEWN